MRTCFLCAKEIPLERRNSVFCSLRCELNYQALERRAPPIDAEAKAEEEPTEDGRPRFGWPGGTANGGDKF